MQIADGMRTRIPVKISDKVDNTKSIHQKQSISTSAQGSALRSFFIEHGSGLMSITAMYSAQ